MAVIDITEPHKAVLKELKQRLRLDPITQPDQGSNPPAFLSACSVHAPKACEDDDEAGTPVRSNMNAYAGARVVNSCGRGHNQLLNLFCIRKG